MKNAKQTTVNTIAIGTMMAHGSIIVLTLITVVFGG